MKNMDLELEITAIEGMLRVATERLNESYSDPAIDMSQCIGEKQALERVLRFLKDRRQLVRSK